MPVLIAILLGIVQGVAEFLPISSSGHLLILQNIFNLDYSEGEHLFFSVLLHLGTLIATILYYKKDIREIIHDAGDFVLKRGTEGRNESGRVKPSLRLLLLIIVGTVPLIIVLPFYSMVERLCSYTGFIAFALIVTGTLLFVSDKLQQGKKTERTATLLDAFVIGLAQAVAVIPGLSRSGTTITVAMCRGFKRKTAVKFSFLLSVPAVAGSFLVTLIKAIGSGIVWANIPAYLLGMVIAGVVGFFAIGVVRLLVNKAKFGKFSYYCWAVGFVTLILSFIL